MKAQTISPVEVKLPWRPEYQFNHLLNINLNDLHPTVTIIVAHALADMPALSDTIENLSRSAVEMRLVCATSIENNFEVQSELQRLELKWHPEIICLDFPANVLYDFELELSHFLINFCDDTSIFLAPDGKSATRDHESCAAAAMVAASRLNVEVAHYQLESNIHSLSMHRFCQKIEAMASQKKDYIYENAWM